MDVSRKSVCVYKSLGARVCPSKCLELIDEHSLKVPFQFSWLFLKNYTSSRTGSTCCYRERRELMGQVLEADVAVGHLYLLYTCRIFIRKS